MKVKRNRILPWGKKFAAINLFGVIFAKHGMKLSPILINHELIHSRQMRELLWIPFYILYVAEWIWLLIKFRGNSFRAYREISFEKEAYRHESENDYLDRRLRFAQWKKEV